VKHSTLAPSFELALIGVLLLSEEDFYRRQSTEPAVTGFLSLCPLFPLTSRNYGDHLKQLLDSGLVLIHELSRPHLVVFDRGAFLHSRIFFTDWRGIVRNEAVKFLFAKTPRIRML
jgi:hypothetical protein